MRISGLGGSVCWASILQLPISFGTLPTTAGVDLALEAQLTVSYTDAGGGWFLTTVSLTLWLLHPCLQFLPPLPEAMRGPTNRDFGSEGCGAIYGSLTVG